MEKEEQILRGRFIDLATRSYKENIYTFTDFLGLMETNLFLSLKKEVSFSPFKLWGGLPESERVMVRFGSPDALGYETDFPITCVQVTPSSRKFAEPLTHRDCLGALMHLGIERSLLGDIYQKENGFFIFCKNTIADFLEENLTKIKHTSVVTTICDQEPEVISPTLVTVSVQVASERLDAVVAKLYKLSRAESIRLFQSQKIFVDGRLMTQNAYTPKLGEIVSVRGFGRFVYKGTAKTTRKGNLVTEVALFT